MGAETGRFRAKRPGAVLGLYRAVCVGFGALIDAPFRSPFVRRDEPTLRRARRIVAGALSGPLRRGGISGRFGAKPKKRPGRLAPGRVLVLVERRGVDRHVPVSTERLDQSGHLMQQPGGLVGLDYGRELDEVESASTPTSLL